ncbi:hypothetical protein tb265_11880 [Gemmatimonadetes bacterium T265]|nr:hypothetical protein tb265_11880 [Gemmatimonadetes bacterium T265]
MVPWPARRWAARRAEGGGGRARGRPPERPAAARAAGSPARLGPGRTAGHDAELPDGLLVVAAARRAGARLAARFGADVDLFAADLLDADFGADFAAARLGADRVAVARFAVARLAVARFAGALFFFAAVFGLVAVVPLAPAFAALALEDAPRFLLAAAPLRAAGFAPDLLPFDAEPEAPPFDVPSLPELLRAREPDVVSPEVLERVAM